MDRRITQLRKGILELAVMGALSQDRHYGYSLVKALTQDGSVSLKEGTIYPILARLDRDQLVKSEWVESAQGPPRKYYSLTSMGQQLFRDLLGEFDLLIALVKANHSSDRTELATGAKEKLLVRRKDYHE